MKGFFECKDTKNAVTLEVVIYIYIYRAFTKFLGDSAEKQNILMIL